MSTEKKSGITVTTHYPLSAEQFIFTNDRKLLWEKSLTASISLGLSLIDCVKIQMKKT